MITLLTGDNSFEIKRALHNIAAAFDGVAEKIDGEGVELSQLADILQGATLFADKRLVIVNNLSENKTLWDVLPEWIPRVSADVHVVLLERKPDKRTKTYKDLKKFADVREFSVWGDRDVRLAEIWVADEAKRQNVALDKKGVQYLVARVGLDQWQLFHALQKLAVLEEVSSEVIEAVIEANPTENVFNLLDAALKGDVRKVHTMVQNLQQSQDPYMTLGLLTSQVFQLSVLAVCGSRLPDEVASDIGAHPFALGKLVSHAKNLGRSGVRKVSRIFADIDDKLKSTATDPWLLIEEALIKTAAV